MATGATWSRGGLLALLAGAAFASPAVAQTRLKLDDAFRTSVQSAAGRLAASDAAGALTIARGLARSADTAVEKQLAGELMLQAAAARSDLQAQRVALSTILDADMAPDGRKGELRALAGIISMMLGEEQDALAQIQYANRLGYASVASQIALADAAFTLNQPDVGNVALQQAIAIRAKDSQPVDPHWYDRAVALSYKAKRPDLVVQWAGRKLATAGQAPDWRSSLVSYIAIGAPGEAQTLDLYRLMAATDALASERDWQAYADIAERAGNAAEAKAALDAGTADGAVNGADAGVRTSLTRLKPAATKALATLPALATKAKTGDAAAAIAAADAHFAAARYAEAADLYAVALTKPGVDGGKALTRRGIALARSGELAGAKTALGEVKEGQWMPVASFWSIWTDLQAARNASAVPATPQGGAS